MRMMIPWGSLITGEVRSLYLGLLRTQKNMMGSSLVISTILNQRFFYDVDTIIWTGKFSWTQPICKLIMREASIKDDYSSDRLDPNPQLMGFGAYLPNQRRISTWSARLPLFRQACLTIDGGLQLAQL